VSTPGPGGQPPENDPDPSGQPQGWGQQRPAGAPDPSQQQWSAPQGTPGQFPGQPGQPGQFPGQFPGQPAGAQAYGAPAEPKKKNKVLQIIGAIAAVIVALVVLTTFLGGGDPEVGDCIKPDGTSFEKVDCDANDAEAKIVGTADDMTGTEFDASDVNELCTNVPSATVVLWSGTDQDKDGKVFCAEGI
jgi:hypothetical protein